MPGGMRGRGAVVTGAGRGIGATVAEALAAAGADVILAARTETEIQRVATALAAGGARTLAVPCDVTDPGDVQRLRDVAVERRVDRRPGQCPAPGPRALPQR